MGLRELTLKISYRSKGDDNVLENFIIPAYKQSKKYKRSVGFFSSSVFELTAEGVETFIDNGGEIQLICSPELSDADIQAIQLGYKKRESIAQDIFLDDLEDAIEKLDNHNLIFLARAIEKNALNIKLVDVDDDFGIYHDKIGIFIDSNNDRVLFVGSPNESKNAYQNNYEKIRLSMSWKPGDGDRIQDDEEEFDSIWNDTNPYLSRTDITKVVGKKIKEKMEQREIVITNSDGGVKLRDYQKNAISNWVKNDYRGFYIMATGTGKTWTAIYSAKKVMDNESIFLVICAPYKHLIKQWKEDVQKVFSQNSIIMISSENTHWQEQLIDAILDSKYGSKKSVIAISTIKSFESEKFERIAKKSNVKRMLIVDEAHRFKNLSSETSRLYRYMLGLSATPSSRKNDEFGKKLVEYFGGSVFNLPIEYAIRKEHLVKYNYWPIFVNATENDEEKFDYYTKRMSSCFRNDICIDVESLAKYKRARLRVISMSEEKTSKIKWILSQIKENDHFIVYCGDGKYYDSSEDGIRHIEFVKGILTEMGYKVSQFTAEESMDRRMQIVTSFNKGLIDTMVAIRCLDEGINIPSIEGALLLSSNDDYREFVQRRGRILRTYYNAITEKKKEIANIYDVIVLPSDYSTSFARIELRRFYEYARLAENKDKNLNELDVLLRQYGLELEDLIDIEDTEEEMDE